MSASKGAKEHFLRQSEKEFQNQDSRAQSKGARCTGAAGKQKAMRKATRKTTGQLAWVDPFMRINKELGLAKQY